MEAVFARANVEEGGGESAVDTGSGFDVVAGSEVEDYLVTDFVTEGLSGQGTVFKNNIFFETIRNDRVDDVRFGERILPGDQIATVFGGFDEGGKVDGVFETKTDVGVGDDELAAGDVGLVGFGEEHGKAISAILVNDGIAGIPGSVIKGVLDFWSKKVSQPNGSAEEAKSSVEIVEAENDLESDDEGESADDEGERVG